MDASQGPTWASWREKPVGCLRANKTTQRAGESWLQQEIGCKMTFFGTAMSQVTTQSRGKVCSEQPQIKRTHWSRSEEPYKCQPWKSDLCICQGPGSGKLPAQAAAGDSTLPPSKPTPPFPALKGLQWTGIWRDREIERKAPRVP